MDSPPKVPCTQGLALNPAAIEGDQPSLYNAIRGHFDSHDDVLRAAGVDPATVRTWISWDKGKIAAALRERHAKGLEMNLAAIGKSDLPLTGAISRFYDSHDDALRAAGFDPDAVRKRRRPPDNDAVFASLRAIANDGWISPAMVKSSDIRLMHLTRKRFGTFETAVTAAGLKYFCGDRAHHGAGHWTEQRVLQTLRDLHQAGHDLRYRPMKTHSQPLFFAAKEHFGSYVNAVREAGIDYWQMSQAQLAKERAAAAAVGESAPAR